MTDLDNQPDTAPLANHSANLSVSADLGGMVKNAFDASPEKFVMFFLFVLVLYVIKILSKFIDAKFIDNRIKTFEVKADTATASNDNHIKEIKYLNENTGEMLTQFQATMQSEFLKAKEELLKIRYEFKAEVHAELDTMKIALGKLNVKFNSDIPGVQAALERYHLDTEEKLKNMKGEVKVLDENFDKVLTGLKKKGL